MSDAAAIPCPPPDPAPRRPRMAVPAGAWDCHFHVFGPAAEYPYAGGRSYTPPDAPVDAYRQVARAVNLARGVIVQPSVYGTDNRRTLAALRDLGPGYRGIAVVDDGASDAELEAMHEAGVRGVRFNLLFGAGLAAESAPQVADRIRGLGWHVQVLADVSQLQDVRAFAGALRVPVVFDHMGHLPAERGVCDPGFQSLLGLMRDGTAWVKLSGAYRVSGLEHPPYPDADAIARALIEANPERCVWGTDWPHPAIGRPMPNDGDLIDLLWRWAPDQAVIERVLVTNPERLYGS